MTTKRVAELTWEELDEQCALARGWTKKNQRFGQHFFDYWVSASGVDVAMVGSTFNFLQGYHPTDKTVEGRGQCFELIDKYNITITCKKGLRTKMATIGLGPIVLTDSLQRSVCECFVRSVKGEFVEVGDGRF